MVTDKSKPPALYTIYLTLASMKYISHYTKILNMINILIFDHYFAPINEQWLNFDLGKTRKSVDKSWPSVFVCVWEGHASSCWLGRPLNQMTAKRKQNSDKEYPAILKLTQNIPNKNHRSLGYPRYIYIRHLW